MGPSPGYALGTFREMQSYFGAYAIRYVPYQLNRG